MKNNKNFLIGKLSVKSDGNNGGNDMMIEDKGVRITFSSRTGLK